ncbi:MAG: 3'(2'),5'-bisphosphate nucleotidase CysQ [Acidobacteriota bacterium]
MSKEQSAQSFLDPLVDLAHAAGQAILTIYQQDRLAVEKKADDSPVTAADLESQRVIVEGLGVLAPEIPVLAEESAAAPWTERRDWDRFWLVDPLDGTREFLARNGEFTVNIALIEDGLPTAGVVLAPALDRAWIGARDAGAFEIEGDARRPIEAKGTGAAEPTIMVSRSHAGEKVERYLGRLGAHQRLPMGSSIKLCLVATGEADLYPRLNPTRMWDTAAGHAVLLAAGGDIIIARAEGVDGAGEPLRYYREELLNPGFVAYGTSGPPAVL